MHKYMFHCSFKDGSSYAENSEDKSIKDDTKSCFYDIDTTYPTDPSATGTSDAQMKQQQTFLDKGDRI